MTDGDVDDGVRNTGRSDGSLDGGGAVSGVTFSDCSVGAGIIDDVSVAFH